MMERLNDPNATVIVYGTASTIGTGYARISGFKSYIEENYPNVTIVETRPSEGAGTRDGCRAWAVDMVTAYPEASAFFGLQWLQGFVPIASTFLGQNFTQ